MNKTTSSFLVSVRVNKISQSKKKLNQGTQVNLHFIYCHETFCLVCARAQRHLLHIWIASLEWKILYLMEECLVSYRYSLVWYFSVFPLCLPSQFRPIQKNINDIRVHGIFTLVSNIFRGILPKKKKKKVREKDS